MNELEKYNQLKKEIISNMILKRNLNIVFAFADIIICIAVNIFYKQYYSIFLFAFVLFYFIYQSYTYNKLSRTEEFNVVEMACLGASRSYLGYSMTNSKIFNFKILHINAQDPRSFYNKWNKDNELNDVPDFEEYTDIQFTHEFKLEELKRENRENSNKFKKGDIVYGVFLTNHKKPLLFSNATLLFAQKMPASYMSKKAIDFQGKTNNATEE